MAISNAKKRLDKWHFFLQKGEEARLINDLEEAPLIEVADFISKLPFSVLTRLFSLFDRSKQAAFFHHLPEDKQLSLYAKLPHRLVAEIFTHIASDMRVDFYQKLDGEEQIRLLPYLSKKVRQDILTLCAYPTDTAGGIMSTDFVTVQENMTVSEALGRLREEAPSQKMMYYLYMVDEEMKMKGIISLKELIMSDLNSHVSTILQEAFVSVQVSEDRESVARKIEKYDLLALPVLNKEQQLVGIVSYDDAMDVIRAEQTEDMERFVGIVPETQAEGYLQTSSFQHFKKRISWITGLFFASFFSALVLHHYEQMLGKLAILFLYLPTINDAGGNAGSQAAAVVTRALFLGQVSVRDWLSIIFKELKVSLLFISCLFFLGFGKVLLFSGWLSDALFDSHEIPLPPEGLYTLALVIATALSLQIVTATLIGASLPLFIKWLGEDPALAASPAITTIVDTTGLIIYFTVAMTLLT